MNESVNDLQMNRSVLLGRMVPTLLHETHNPNAVITSAVSELYMELARIVETLHDLRSRGDDGLLEVIPEKLESSLNHIRFIAGMIGNSTQKMYKFISEVRTLSRPGGSTDGRESLLRILDTTKTLSAYITQRLKIEMHSNIDKFLFVNASASDMLHLLVAIVTSYTDAGIDALRLDVNTDAKNTLIQFRVADSEYAEVQSTIVEGESEEKQRAIYDFTNLASYKTISCLAARLKIRLTTSEDDYQNSVVTLVVAG